LCGIFGIALSRTGSEFAITLTALSTTALMWAMSAKGSLGEMFAVGRVLSSRPVRTLGLLSYSLYLWHWPVFMVFALTVGLRSSRNMTLSLALIVVLSLASYFFVENRYRDVRIFPWQKTLRMLVLTAISILALALGIEMRPGFAYF